MEEKDFFARPILTGSRGSTVRFRVGAIFCLTFVLGLWRYFGDVVLGEWLVKEKPSVLEEGWKWSNIEPAKELIWHPCYEVYDCAKLDVPLDWLDPRDEHRASIAVIRFNATERENYKGSVFINPGGPGGSGIWFMKHLAQHYQTVVGKNYDIISFDPRGVGFSTPHISCFKTPQSSTLWDLLTPPVLDAHPSAIYEAFARATALSQHCSSTYHSNTTTTPSPNPLNFLSTASTARDLLALLLLTTPQNPKLHYWGFSYGTYLGLTFASLFPSQTGHLVLDGNVDASELSSGLNMHFITDAEAVISSFYTFCHAAGPSGCDFYASSPGLIKIRLDKLLSSLKKNPVIVPGDEENIPKLVTYSSVKRGIASALYRPILLFPRLATSLLALSNGNGTHFLSLFPPPNLPLSDPPLPCSPSLSPSPSPPIPPEVEEEGNPDATRAILCSDMLPVNDDVEEFKTYVKELEGTSPSVGAVMAGMRLDCVGRRERAKWRFGGRFEVPAGFEMSPGILFVANLWDNVTPHRAALRNARGFPGSVVLVLEAYGHTSLSTPSHCITSSINKYFQTSILPPKNTVCRADMVPFGDINDTLGVSGQNSDIDNEFKRAMRALMKFGVPRIGF